MPFSTEQKQRLSSKFDKLLIQYTKPAKQIHGLIIGWTDAEKDQYVKFKGKLDHDTNKDVDRDSVFSLFSCTKSMTALGLLKLWEDGKVDLDVPAATYLPLIDSIGLVEKGTVDSTTGKFTVPPRKPTKPVTLRNLLNQTAGFAYGFLNEDYKLLATKQNPEVHAGKPSMELFTTEKTPLVFEPGSGFQYGHGMDFVGLIIQEVTGKRLSEYLKEVLFDPTGMNSTGFQPVDTSNFFQVYLRTNSGKVLPVRDVVIDTASNIDMGGQGAFSTIGDFLKYLRLWLNYGYSPDTGKRILKKETVEYATKNHLPDGMTIKFGIGEPPLHDGFSLAGMGVSRACPTGRPDGALFWSGLVNLFFWIDLENQFAGMWVTQVLPFFDPRSFLGYCKMEAAFYDVLSGDDDDDDDDEDEDEEEDEEGGDQERQSSSKL